MEEAKLKRLQGDEYLDLMQEHGNINDIDDLVAVVRALREEKQVLERRVEEMTQAAQGEGFRGLYAGARMMRGYAVKVAQMHNAHTIAEHIEGLPLPGESTGTKSDER